MLQWHLLAPFYRMNNMESQYALKFALLLGSTMLLLPQDPQPPALKDVYWGPGVQSGNVDTSIRPFNISFSSKMIDDLQFRLNNTRELEPSLENAHWSYGMNRQFVPFIIDYWMNNYDFKKAEERLNQYPQFITNIQGLNIYYIHVKPKLPKGSPIKVLPLLIQHGWPGSVVEFHKIIPMLTTPRADRDFVFEVIAPSLPGFGYSDASAKIGLTAIDVAHLLRNLMIRVGFDKWYTQGGDWGAIITAHMAAIYPENILGVHSNFCIIIHPTIVMKYAIYSLWPSLLLPEERSLMMGITNATVRIIEITGYFHQQATRPDTLGVGMNDSPAALATWILEKFFGSIIREIGSTKVEDLLQIFTMDELIDNVMLYWAPNKITSSFRIYAESFNTRSVYDNLDSLPITVPSACAQFPFDTLFLPEKILRDRYVNMVHRKIMPRAGHFAALTEPQLLADDVFEAVTKMQEFNNAEQAKQEM